MSNHLPIIPTANLADFDAGHLGNLKALRTRIAQLLLGTPHDPDRALESSLVALDERIAALGG